MVKKIHKDTVNDMFRYYSSFNTDFWHNFWIFLESALSAHKANFKMYVYVCVILFYYLSWSSFGFTDTFLLSIQLITFPDFCLIV